MKLILSILISFIYTSNIINAPVSYKKQYITIYVDYTLKSIIKTESNDGKYIIGRNNDIGILQITPIFVYDVNRIVGYNKYNLNDRYNIKKSIEMYYIIQHYYLKKYNLEYNLKNASQIHHRATKIDEQNNYFNKCKINMMKLILTECDENHRNIIMSYISGKSHPKHSTIEVKTKMISTDIAYTNSQNLLLISLKPSLLNIPKNIGNIIKDLI